MTTVAVLWGPFGREVLEAVRPDHLVSAPGELLEISAR
jgi:phosphoglycolate phosphatase-like HAD superfamily hydrolase